MKCIRISIDDEQLHELMSGGIVTIHRGVPVTQVVELALQDIGSERIVELADNARIEVMERARSKKQERSD